MLKKFSAAILGLTVMLGTFSAMTTTAVAKDKNQRNKGNSKWERDREWRRGGDDDGERRWRRDRRRNDDSYRGRGYNNGRYGYPGNNNGRYGNGRYGNTGYNNNYELNRGYQQGLNTGASDAQRGQSYSPERSRHYRNASTQDFREGFVRGYDQGYRQYAGYNNGYRSSNSGSVWRQILGLP